MKKKLKLNTFFLVPCLIYWGLAFYPLVLTAGNNKSEVYIRNGMKALKAGQWSEAMRMFKKAAVVDKKSQQAIWGKALVYIKKGDYKSAKSLCRSFIARKKTSPLAHTCLGYAQLLWKRSSLAEKSFNEALALDPNFSLAIAGAGHALMLKGKYSEAEEKYRQALENSPYEVEALKGITEVLLKKNKRDEALKILTSAMKNPDLMEDPEFLFCVAKAHGKGKEAEQNIKKAVEIRKDWPEGYGMMGKILFEGGKYEEAEKSLEKAIELEPNLVEAGKYLGMCKYNMGRYQEAIDTLKEVLQKVPNMAEAKYYIGLSYDAMNNYEQAEEAYREAMNMNLKYPAPVLSLGYLYYRTGKPTSAMSTMEKAAKLCPDCSLAYLVMADIYFERGSYKNAEENYKKALAGNMKDVDKRYIEEKLNKITQITR